MAFVLSRKKLPYWSLVFFSVIVGAALNLQSFLNTAHGKYIYHWDPSFRKRSKSITSSRLLSVSRTSAYLIQKGTEASRVFVRGESVNDVIYITYLARSGLCNQLFAHLNALALAHYMNATLIVSPAGTRNETSSLNPSFQSISVRALLDMDQMVPYWQQRGLKLTEHIPGLRDCMLVDIWRGLPTTTPEFLYDLPEAASMLLNNISAQLTARQLGGEGQPPCIHIFAANIFHLLDQQRSIPYLYPAAQGLFYNPQVLEAANQVVRALNAKGHTQFRGAHLRLEGDWALASHYKEGVKPYIETMKKGSFNNASALYIASGLFSSWNISAILALERELKDSGVMGVMYHKESLLDASILQGFNLEQQALIDLHVLVEAQEFVGHPWSTFACYVRELRAMQGARRTTFLPIMGQLDRRYFFAPEGVLDMLDSAN